MELTLVLIAFGIAALLALNGRFGTATGVIAAAAFEIVGCCLASLRVDGSAVQVR